jgi:Salmonella virulence plasmid 65kDa B protein
MPEVERAPEQVISRPHGRGALRGLGGKFSPDLQTGTGNLSVPIAVPPGRRPFEPQLGLVYSTANPAGHFGLG